MGLKKEIRRVTRDDIARLKARASDLEETASSMDDEQMEILGEISKLKHEQRDQREILDKIVEATSNLDKMIADMDDPAATARDLAEAELDLDSADASDKFLANTPSPDYGGGRI